MARYVSRTTAITPTRSKFLIGQGGRGRSVKIATFYNE